MSRLTLIVAGTFLASQVLLACASPAAPQPTAAPAAPAASAPAVATVGPYGAAPAATAGPAPTVVAASAPVTTATPATSTGTSAPVVQIAKDAKLGEILTDTRGMTLYRFANDAAGTSSCYDQCAQNWPPLLVTAGKPIGPAGLAGQLGVTTRKDGSKQATYNGVPLYHFAKDQKPGDTTGQNVGNVWFVVPEGN